MSKSLGNKYRGALNICFKCEVCWFCKILYHDKVNIVWLYCWSDKTSNLKTPVFDWKMTLGIPHRFLINKLTFNETNICRSIP